MSRKPDYRVGALNRQTDEIANIGVAWVNPSGSISVVLDAFVRIDGGKDLLITLFPNTEDKPS